MAAPEILTRMVEGWASTYSHSKAVSNGVIFLHLAALLLGGGAAVAADRATVRAGSAGEAHRDHHLAELAALHPIVLSGLALAFGTGLLLFLADLDTYWTMGWFWLKLGLIAVLLGNGYAMLRAERAVRAGVETAWPRLKATAIASAVLWFTIVLVSTIMTSAG